MCYISQCLINNRGNHQLQPYKEYVKATFGRKLCDYYTLSSTKQKLSPRVTYYMLTRHHGVILLMGSSDNKKKMSSSTHVRCVLTTNNILSAGNILCLMMLSVQTNQGVSSSIRVQ